MSQNGKVLTSWLRLSGRSASGCLATASSGRQLSVRRPPPAAPHAAVRGYSSRPLQGTIDFTDKTSRLLADRARHQSLLDLLSRIGARRWCTAAEYARVVAGVKALSAHSVPFMVEDIKFVILHYRPDTKSSLSELFQACTVKISEYLATGDGDVTRVLRIVNFLSCIQTRSNRDDAAVASMLSALAGGLNRLPTGCALPDELAGDALWGLQHMRTAQPGVREFLGAMARCIRPDSNAHFGGDAFLGKSLYGLQSMRNDCPELLQLLSVLARRLNSYQGSISGQTISSALYGLKSMSAANQEVQAVVAAVSRQMRTAEPMSLNEISGGLFGLKSMTGKSEPVRHVLIALAKMISDTPPGNQWTGQIFSNALFGIQGVSNDTPELWVLIQTILDHVESSQSQIVLKNQGLGLSFLGMKRMTMQHPQNRRLLQLLGRFLASCPEPLSSQTLAMIMQGLKSMSRENSEVRFVIAQLSQKLESSPRGSIVMTPDGLSLAFNGLKNFSSSNAEALRLLEILTDMLETSSETFDAKKLSRLASGLRGMKSGNPVVDRAFAAIGKRMTLADCKKFRGVDIVHALNGINSADVGSEVIAQIMRTLTAAMTNLSELSPLEMSRTLYDLKSKDGDSKEVLALVEAVADKMRASDASWSSRELASSLYGLSGMNSDSDEVKLLLNELKAKLLSYRGAGFENSQSYGMSLYGLQNMDTKVIEVQDLFFALGTVLSRSRDLKLSPIEIMNSFYGLKTATTDSNAVLKVFRLLVEHLEATADELPPRAIAGILKGINGMCCHVPAVQQVASILAERLDQSGGAFNAMELGNCFYGLQSMSIDKEEVQNLVRALSLKLESSTDSFGNIFFASCLFGLRNMHSRHALIQDLLRQLAQKIASSEELFAPQTISNTLYGLQNMSSDDDSVRELLKELNSKIRQTGTFSMTTQGIGNAFYGLQCMNSKSNEVQELLVLLKEKMKCSADSQSEYLNPQEVGNSIYGLRYMSYDAPGMSEILQLLHEETLYCVNLFTQIPSFSWERWMRVLFHSIVLTIPRIPDISPHVVQQYMDTMPTLSALLLEWETSEPATEREQDFASATEKRTYEILKAHYGADSPVCLSSNNYLHHFEADIILSLPGDPDAPSTVINIEVDGAPSHALSTSARFQGYRDEYLREKDVTVLRLKGDQLRDLDPSNVPQTLEDLLLGVRFSDRVANFDDIVQRLCSR